MPYVALSKSAAEDLISQYSAQVSQTYGEYTTEKAIAQMEEKVSALEKIALQAYSALGFNSGSVEAIEQQLRQSVLEIQKETSALNGLDLQQNFLQALKEANAFQLDYSKELDQIQKYVSTNLGKEVSSGEVATVLHNEFIQATEGAIPTEIVIQDSRARQAGTGKFALDFTKTFSKLSKTTHDIFVKYRNSPQGQKFLKNISQEQASTNNNSYSARYILETVDLESLLKMPSEERKRVFDQYPNLKDSINRAFIKKIVEACPVSRKDILTKCIQDVLQAKPLAFFVGGNIEGMTGILGEIQGFYLFRKLLENSSTGANVQWIGGVNNPHADLILTQGLQQFGIQVKNTSQQNAELEVGFQSFGATKGGSIAYTQPNQAVFQYQNTSEALNSLSDLAPTELIEAIQTFLAMQGFNITYNWDSSSGSAKEVESNPDFDTVRLQIEEYAGYAQKIASLFAASMMYMQQDFVSNGSSNTLYLIGGATLVSAATILKDIVQDIKGALNRFKVSVEGHSAVKGKKGAKTIVDVINAKGHLGDTKFMLESSYTFGL